MLLDVDSLVTIAGIEGSDDDALVTGEQDEELSRWEQEQIRKGINIPQVRKPRFLNMKREVEGRVLLLLLQCNQPVSLRHSFHRDHRVGVPYVFIMPLSKLL